MRASSSLVKFRDCSLFFNGHIPRNRKIPQCCGLALARAYHPLQKTGECIPFGVIRTTRRHNNPGKGTDWINARTRGIHDRDFEVTKGC